MGSIVIAASASWCRGSVAPDADCSRSATLLPPYHQSGAAVFALPRHFVVNRFPATPPVEIVVRVSDFMVLLPASQWVVPPQAVTPLAAIASSSMSHCLWGCPFHHAAPQAGISGVVISTPLPVPERVRLALQRSCRAENALRTAAGTVANPIERLLPRPAVTTQHLLPRPW